MTPETEETLKNKLLSLPLEAQVAQRLILGYKGKPDEAPANEWFNEFLQLGLGGIIFFRENFEALEPLDPSAIAQLLCDITQAIPEGVPRPFLTLDQEGGQVERLPHTAFPSSISPLAVALALKGVESNEFCAEVYDLSAYYLSLLGFNMNLFPTLDLNLEKRNPVIGPRSFGSDPDEVWRFAKVAMERLEARKILAVGKHFPGHGNGTVDSHDSLPTLHFTSQELEPFKQAIQHKIPALMIAHGYYPALQETAGEVNVPATASKTIIQDLLREDLGFQGLTLSDDMGMGAVTKGKDSVEPVDPVESAILALEAGIDLLVYRESSETQWMIHQGIVKAIESGRLNREAHEQALGRIATQKVKLPPSAPDFDTLSKVMSLPAIQAVSSFLAGKGLTILHDNKEFDLPVDPEDLLWVIHPDRGEIPAYYPDVSSSSELPDLLKAEGLNPIYEYRYPLGETIPFPDESPESSESPEVVVFITYSPQLHAGQTEFYEALRKRHPDVFILMISAGTADEREWMPEVDMHFAMCGYRPASLKALSEILANVPEPESPRNKK